MTPLMLDIQKLEDERDRARLGLGPVLHYVNSLDDLRGSRQVVNIVGLFLQVYPNGEVSDQVRRMMLPESEGGTGPEYWEPRA